MPSKKKANNDESRADKEVAEIWQLLDTGTDYSELVRLRELLRVPNNCERLSDDLIRSLLKKFQVSEKGQQKKTLLKRLQHIVDPPHDDLKQMDTDVLSGKKISHEQLVSYYFETHGYLPVKNTTKKDLAKEIIAARSGRLNFYLDLSYNQIKDILVNKYGRRYHNDTVQRKTLVEHLRTEEESHENKPDDRIRRTTTELQNEIIDLMEEEEEESRDDLRVDFVAPSTPPPQYLRPDPSPSNVDTAPKDTRPMKKKNEPNNSPENQSPLVPLNDEAGAAGLGNGRSVDTRPDPPSAGNSTRFGPKDVRVLEEENERLRNENVVLKRRLTHSLRSNRI